MKVRFLRLAKIEVMFQPFPEARGLQRWDVLAVSGNAWGSGPEDRNEF